MRAVSSGPDSTASPVVPADAAEPWVARFFPALSKSDGPKWFFAYENQNQRPIAAAALFGSGNALRFALRTIDLRTIEASGREVPTDVVSRALWGCALRKARELTARSVVAPGWWPDDGPAAELWRSLGFERTAESSTYELAAAETLERMTPTWRRLQSRRGNAFRLAAIGVVNPVDIVRLHVSSLGGDGRGLLAKLTGRTVAGAVSRTLSTAIFRDDRLAGFTLVSLVDESTATVDSIVVVPELRGTSAAYFMKYEILLRCRQDGVGSMRFTASGRQPDTQKTAQRYQARVIERSHRYRFSLEAPQEP